MKAFGLQDVSLYSSDHTLSKYYLGRIDCLYSELIDLPLWFHKRGLSPTATGYGSKLPSPYMVNFAGRNRRIYVTCYANNGSAWFRFKDKRILIDAIA